MYNRSPQTPSQRSPRHNGYPPTAMHQQQQSHPPPPPPSAGPMPALNGGLPPGMAASAAAAARESGRPATFYDPTSEARHVKPTWSPATPQGSYGQHPSANGLDRDHPSPASAHRMAPASHHHPPPPSAALSYVAGPPRSPTFHVAPNGHGHMPPPAGTPSQHTASPVRPASNARVSDPMSFSSILSSGGPEPRRSSPELPRRPLQNSADYDPNRPDYPTPPSAPAFSSRDPLLNGSPMSDVKPGQSPFDDDAMPNVNGSDTYLGLYQQNKPKKPKPVISDKSVQVALAKIESADESDIDENDPVFFNVKQEYVQRRLKRVREIEAKEEALRKRRRVVYIQKHAAIFSKQAELAKERFFTANEEGARQEILLEDQARERERKKLNQRARRHELQKTKHEKEAQELLEKARNEEDEAEREKLLRQVNVAEKRANIAQAKLDHPDDPLPTGRDETPVGGVMGSFPMSEDGPDDQPKKRGRAGGRLKKSKEQKQAEKDRAAAAADAAMERGDDMSLLSKTLAPRDLSIRDGTPSLAPASKAYESLYEQIWRDIARKDIPKLVRIKDNSLSTKQSNLRKTAQLASKEARRWQLKTNKSTKDTQARAKRAMREMLSYWKRNERDERDQRKMAEKQELENAKKAEAEREANRQKRKLNFLISQTELYSHFIGKKVKTDEVERSTDDVSASGQLVKDQPGAHTIDLPPSLGKPGLSVTNFEDLDFDAEDDSVLREAAMANAQKAVQDAQDRARAFNEGGMDSTFDDGEMNFQNPTSLQGTDIPQPGMLSCQLKEYQLKGLNWLVNLYEQGINGILADEMGLGKTVQSISVMAYLAEVHNIWGPFLVIAPASTLHNWQQEIVKFVPDLKALPYWGNAKDRKVLRKFWDRKHITYNKDSPFHVLITSYQLVVQDAQYFQKVKWQYMILDEAQAIKSSQSSRWKSLLGFHCRNRLLLTGTPIQNSMQELWALLHFIMPSLFDSHDEFSEWFSKDIESHAQSNTKLNEDQLKRLHMILKPFMLRRIKKHVQKELGDKVEKDVFCDLTYRQRAYYSNLRNKISIMDLIEKATIGDDQDTATLMNLVMQFRKVCNHPDLFERAETTSPVSFGYFAETASFMREGHFVDVSYSVRSLIEYNLPKLVARDGGRLDIPGPENPAAGFRNRFLMHELNVFSPINVHKSKSGSGAFSWLSLTDKSASELSDFARKDLFARATDLKDQTATGVSLNLNDEDKENQPHRYKGMLNIVETNRKKALPQAFGDGPLHDLMHLSEHVYRAQGINAIEPCTRPSASAPPIELFSASQGVLAERSNTFFNIPMRRALFPIPLRVEEALVDSRISPKQFPPNNMLPAPISEKGRFTHIQVPSMRRFVTDSGKLAKLDELLGDLKAGGHRVLLYFQMTRMIDLMEEYLTYRNYKYCRLDGSTKLEDRRDTVADFQQDPSIFVFLLSTRAGGLGINLTAADTVIFYDSDWNPTIDSQAMDRAHRLGQTRQVTVYRMITRGTIEERIRRRALQKEEVQRVVISGGAPGAHTVDFNTRSRENRTKDIAMWLADDDQAAEIEKKEAELAEREAKDPAAAAKARGKKKARTGKEISLDDMYHEGEGHFDDSGKPSGAATPVVTEPPTKKRKGISKKAKTAKEKLAIIDGMA